MRLEKLDADRHRGTRYVWMRRPNLLHELLQSHRLPASEPEVVVLELPRLLEVALDHVNDEARVPICGQISRYNATEPAVLRNVEVLLDKGVRLQGFRIGSRLARRDEALEQLLDWWRADKLKYRETVSVGFETAPAALINMLTGGNYGKQVVQVV